MNHMYIFRLQLTQNSKRILCSDVPFIDVYALLCLLYTNATELDDSIHIYTLHTCKKSQSKQNILAARKYGVEKNVQPKKAEHESKAIKFFYSINFYFTGFSKPNKVHVISDFIRCISTFEYCK